MSLLTTDNMREPFSRITDTRLLRPGDELQMQNNDMSATIGVLDSHDPLNFPLSMPAIQAMRGAFDILPLPAHHHVLMQFQGAEAIMSAGLFIGVGEADDVYFDHVTYSQMRDPVYLRKMLLVSAAIEISRPFELIYVSDDEQLSRSPRGSHYVAGDRWLIR